MLSNATFGCAAATQVPTTIRYFLHSELVSSYILSALYRVKAIRWIFAMLASDAEKTACSSGRRAVNA
jgi:hypothetical protein